MKRTTTAAVIVLVLCLPVVGATLERLSMDDMITKSTAIVRGKVLSSYSAFRGRTIYTFWRVQVQESLKGSAAAVTVEVVTPGGKAGGYEQNFSGSPSLAEGSEYLLFLWTGKSSGLTHVIGLSQGLFSVQKNAQGELMAVRGAATELMLDPKTKQPVADQAVTMRLRDVSQQISRTLAGGAR